MLPGLTIPASLAVLLQGFRSCFRLRSFAVFCLLAVGMIAQTGACTITGMMVGAGMQAMVAHDRLHRLFSTHAWSADQLGLAVARLLVATLLPAGTDLHLAADDSLFRRRGTKVHAALWTHDASQPGQVTARGNRWVIVGIVVTPCCTSPRRPHRQAGTPPHQRRPHRHPAQAAAGAAWRQATVARYGRTDTVPIAEVACLWDGAFGNRTRRLIAVHDTGRQLLLFTTNPNRDRRADHRPVRRQVQHPGRHRNREGPHGVGQARNRVPAAVHRTVPFGMLTMSLVSCWYARYGHHPDDVTDRRAAAPWYPTTTEPSFADMLATLRRTSSPPDFSLNTQAQLTSQQINAVHRAWA